MLNTQLLASAKDDKSIDGGLFSHLSGAPAANRPTDKDSSNAELPDEFGKALTDWMGSGTDADSGTPSDLSAEQLSVESAGDKALAMEKIQAWLQQLSPDAREKLLSQLQSGNNLPAAGEGFAAELSIELPAELRDSLPEDLTEAEFLQGLKQLFGHTTDGQLKPVDADSAAPEPLDAEQVMQWFDKLTSYLAGKPIDNAVVTDEGVLPPGADPETALEAMPAELEPAAKLAAALGVAADQVSASQKAATQPVAAQQATVRQARIEPGADAHSSGQAGDNAPGAEVLDPEAKVMAGGRAEPKADLQTVSANLPAGQTDAATESDIIEDGLGLVGADKAGVAKARGELSFQPAALAVEQHNRAAAAQLEDTSVSAEVSDITETAQLAPGEQRNAVESLRQANTRHELAQESLNMRQGQVEKALSEKMMMMLSRNMQAAEVRLDPPELGSMMIRVQVQQDQATVQFNVSNPQAREALEQALPRLREMLAQQGINLGDAEINQQQQNQGQTGEEYADATTSQQAEDGEWLETELPADQQAVSYAATGRIDYFA